MQFKIYRNTIPVSWLFEWTKHKFVSSINISLFCYSNNSVQWNSENEDCWDQHTWSSQVCRKPVCLSHNSSRVAPVTFYIRCMRDMSCASTSRSPEWRERREWMTFQINRSHTLHPTGKKIHLAGHTKVGFLSGRRVFFSKIIYYWFFLGYQRCQHQQWWQWRNDSDLEKVSVHNFLPTGGARDLHLVGCRWRDRWQGGRRERGRRVGVFFKNIISPRRTLLVTSNHRLWTLNTQK